MAQNIFEELKDKKDKLRILIEKAFEYHWIDAKRKDEFIDNLDKDTLCIGVIGQMKCGKSTFLNSFVFEDDVLPSATTPMTAALSVITYGETKSIKAEFYTPDEWAEQKMMASRSLDEAGESEASKIKAAKELVEKSVKLGNVEQYLGKNQDDEFENLIEYVGADGKYVSITKSVTIFYPKEYLKGVEIVDTPGFNDPIVSREERTKEFLNKADVVLLMLYAGRPFDATDRDILFKNVKSCGIGHVLVGVNKYDIPYMNGESEEEIVNYVSLEIQKASKEMGDESLNDILRETRPIPLSAEMALLSEMPMSKITSNEVYNFNWKRACNNFEISSQSQMRDKSHIDNLIGAVKDLVNKKKGEILIAKPLNAIKAAGSNKKSELDKERNLVENLLKDLSKPDSELEEKQSELQKAARRLNKKIDSLGDDLDDDFTQLTRKGKNSLEDLVTSSCNKMRGMVESWGTFSNEDDLIVKLKREQEYLTTRILPREVEVIRDEVERKLKSTKNSFFDDVTDYLSDHIEDFDAQEFVKSVRVSIDAESDKLKANSFKEGEKHDVANGVATAVIGVAFGAIGIGAFQGLKAIWRGINHGDKKNEFMNRINTIESSFDAMKVMRTIIENKEITINLVKEKFIDGLIVPMQKQIEECLNNKADKENKKKEAESRLASLSEEIKLIEGQMSELKAISI